MAFGGFDKGSSAPMAEINTTPLVDVMLVLLVVFIITAPVLSHAIKVDLPQATASEHKEDVKAIRFTITGFFLLAVGFIGSKFVLEMILSR